jgi:hypothetical protein
MFFGFGDYNFSTTVQFSPHKGFFDFLTGHPNFSQYEKSQIDWWMRQSEGAYSVINTTSDVAGNLYYIVGGQDAKLVNDSLARIKPQIEKFSDIAYTLPQAITESAGVVGQVGAKVIKTAGKAAGELAVPIVKSLMPYVFGGILLVGGALFLYATAQKKVRSYVARS